MTNGNFKIGVMGAGAMGSGIAQPAASWFQVLNDIEMSFVDKAISRIDSLLSASIEKGK